MAKKKIDENEKPRVHKDLEGFDIQINSFGEITTSFEIDKINQFLNRAVDDKKLRHRDDLKMLRGEKPDDSATAPATAPADTDLEADSEELPDEKLFTDELDEDDLKN
jgi:hypothetical protein